MVGPDHVLRIAKQGKGTIQAMSAAVHRRRLSGKHRRPWRVFR